MSHGRETILGRIRAALRRGPLSADAAGKLRERLAAPRPNIVPARATRLDHEGQVALFIAMAEAVQATVARVADAGLVPAAVADYLARDNLPSRVVMTQDPQLDAVPWHEWPPLEIRRGVAEDGDPVGITACFAAIAETGTLMLTSGPHGSTRNNFLPDTHIVVVRGSQLLPTYEEGWARLRASARTPDGEWAMPRTVNFITGPSSTGDIEQRLVLGAHGARRLHIVLIDDPKPAAPAVCSAAGPDASSSTGHGAAEA